MAALAETINEYVPLDSLPGVSEFRQEVRANAWALVREREMLRTEHGESVIPLQIDAVSTAEHVLAVGSAQGKDSAAYQESLQGLSQDCLRLVAEWYRKLKPEYFKPIRHFFNAENGDYYSHGISVRQMTENALRPISDNPEEVGRRVNERVEDATPSMLKKIGGFALGSVGIRTLSECTDKAIEEYQNDVKAHGPHRGYDGYVPEIEKLMIRDMRFDEQTGDRLQEQIGLPGVYINHFIIQMALSKRGVNVGHMDKTELHGAQLLVQDDLLDFIKLLDATASEQWCTNIFMGEEVAVDPPKDYAGFREEAIQRQEGLIDTAQTVALFLLDLAQDGVDKRLAPALVEEFVKKLLLNMAKNDNSLAYQMFDKETAVGLREVTYLESMGRHKEAFELFQEVEAAAPGGGYCGGASCGLESVDANSEVGKALKEKLQAADGDTIVKDKVRPCKCGRKSVVYAYNKHKVNKLCTGCGAFESKVSKVA